MRLETIMWTGLTLFYVAIGVIYWLVDGDPAGASLLLMATGLGGLIAGWMWGWRRHNAHPRPADRGDADVEDEVGVVGVSTRRPACGRWSSASGSPPPCSAPCSGSWMLLVGVAITLSQVALLTRDADR